MQAVTSDQTLATPLFDWGIELLRQIERTRHPALTEVLVWITDLGGGGGYLLLVPLIWWMGSGESALKILCALSLSVWSNEILKAWSQIDRPFLYAELDNLRQETGYSFPSGHAQAAGVFWALLALLTRKRWTSLLASLMIVLIGFSRLYLGVHYPHDVLFGWVLGIGLAYGFWSAGPSLSAWITKLNRNRLLLLSLGLPLALVLVRPDTSVATAMGGTSGMAVGQLVHGRFDTQASGWIRWRRLVVGFGGVALLIWLATFAAPPRDTRWYLPHVFATLFFVGLWTSWGVYRLVPAPIEGQHDQ